MHIEFYTLNIPLKLSRLLHGYNAVAHVPTYTIAHVRVILMRDIVNLTLHNSICISKVVDIIAHSGLWSCVVVLQFFSLAMALA